MPSNKRKGKKTKIITADEIHKVVLDSISERLNVSVYRSKNEVEVHISLVSRGFDGNEKYMSFKTQELSKQILRHTAISFVEGIITPHP